MHRLFNVHELLWSQWSFIGRECFDIGTAGYRFRALQTVPINSWHE